MQDQVMRLNATVGQGVRDIATFLGSSQFDGSAEVKLIFFFEFFFFLILIFVMFRQELLPANSHWFM